MLAAEATQVSDGSATSWSSAVYEAICLQLSICSYFDMYCRAIRRYVMRARLSSSRIRWLKWKIHYSTYVPARSDLK